MSKLESAFISVGLAAAAGVIIWGVWGLPGITSKVDRETTPSASASASASTSASTSASVQISTTEAAAASPQKALTVSAPKSSLLAAARADKSLDPLRAEAAILDYERARYHPLHFTPRISAAKDGECLVCHEEILTHKPHPETPAGLKASDVRAWYQTLDTYLGEQESFHYRHIESPFAKQVMNLSCNFCHQGNDPREELPRGMRQSTAQDDSQRPDRTLRKTVNPTETCLRCHGAMPDPVNIMGLEGPWPQVRTDFEDAETANGCLICHGDGFRSTRHQVTYLNAEAIETAAQQSSDVCLGCHGGRQWYRTAYPYPRNPWPDMDEEVPDWAKDRPTASDPAYRLTK